VAPDDVAVLQTLLQQSPFCMQEVPEFRHDVPPELPLPIVTVTVTHSDWHEPNTHCPYLLKASTPFGYCASQPQLVDEPADGEPLLHELTHCAYVRQSAL